MAAISLSLRSPRATLGGCILLPRLIDKVRLHALGQLPPAYAANLLGPDHTLDGRFLAFTGLDANALTASDSQEVVRMMRLWGGYKSTHGQLVRDSCE